MNIDITYCVHNLKWRETPPCQLILEISQNVDMKILEICDTVYSAIYSLLPIFRDFMTIDTFAEIEIRDTEVVFM